MTKKIRLDQVGKKIRKVLSLEIIFGSDDLWSTTHGLDSKG